MTFMFDSGVTLLREMRYLSLPGVKGFTLQVTFFVTTKIRKRKTIESANPNTNQAVAYMQMNKIITKKKHSEYFELAPRNFLINYQKIGIYLSAST